MYPNHLWSYDFVADRTSDGRPIRILTIIDEYTRECLSIHTQRRIKAPEILYKLSELFITKGVPDHIRSDNGSEFSAKSVRGWLILFFYSIKIKSDFGSKLVAKSVIDKVWVY